MKRPFCFGRSMHTIFSIVPDTHTQLSKIMPNENWIESESKIKTISKIIRKWSMMEYFAFCIVYLCHHVKHIHSHLHLHSHIFSHRTANFIKPPIHYHQFKIATMLIGSQYKSFNFIGVFFVFGLAFLIYETILFFKTTTRNQSVS